MVRDKLLNNLAVKILVAVAGLAVLMVYIALVWVLPFIGFYWIQLGLITGLIGVFAWLIELALVLTGIVVVIVLVDWWW
ncbi:hypothetical protein H9L19_06735 [Weissella diestrammenae]|uniref:Uncharacterized protein n=1 Tax=Weissella diestrammenae TaxID=1162633 RepID=A0A7G9T4P2_9LACO|nr:hypothetical protein [Weissella diestrammenae]MCM0582774.1 hypothetical protein [Weissella diestrammenae]QNN75067.1 hypothetical protein H9L19_06735 [Weissella diestrammenae]